MYVGISIIFFFVHALLATTLVKAVPVAQNATLERRAGDGLPPGTMTPRLMNLAHLGDWFIVNGVLPHRTTVPGGLPSRQNVRDWQNTNFAVVYYEYRDTNGISITAFIDSFNEGNRGYHSEEALFNILNGRHPDFWRPITVFTERQPCANCLAHMSTITGSRARGHDVTIFYISPYPPANLVAIQTFWI